MRTGEKGTAITGIGMSAIGRPSESPPLALAANACLDAIADANLSIADIDGVATWPGFLPGSTGMSEVGIHEIRRALGLRLNWFTGARETPGQLGAVFNAVAAVVTGLAKNVLVFRVISEASARSRDRAATVIGGGTQRASGVHEWTLPFGAVSPVSWFALYAQRHFHEFGTTREELAQIALNARRNAQRNPAAVFRTPLTLDDYMQSRMVSEPLCLNDCDVPVDAAVAFVVSRIEHARDLPNPVLRVEAIGSALHRGDNWFRPSDLTVTSASDAAAMMWSRTELKPKDIDVAQLYDGFSIHTLMWLEALGFCGRGEGGSYIEGGRRISLDGELPVNTSGGQLSAGRLHGLGFVHEACVQLWNRGGERQVAPVPRNSVVTAGLGGGFSGCMLLARE